MEVVPAIFPGSYAPVEPVSVRFPIPLHTESLAGLWVPLPSQGAKSKLLMQAMPYALLT